MYESLISNLREYAEWAAANEWETPITLGDDLLKAAETIEKLLPKSERLHICNKCKLEFYPLHNYCPCCGGTDYVLKER